MQEELKEKHLKGVSESNNRAQREPFRKASTGAPMSAAVVLEDRDYYRSMAKRAVGLVVLMAICVVCLVSALAYQSTRPITTLSYITDEDGRFVEVAPTAIPTVSDAQLLIWAADRISDFQGLSFTNYADHVLSLRQYFSEDGFSQYQSALKTSKTVDKIKRDRLTTWIQPTEAPRITDKGVVGDAMTWVVEMPFVQFYEGGEISNRTGGQVATLLIRRTSRTKNAAGLMVAKYLVRKEA